MAAAVAAAAATVAFLQAKCGVSPTLVHEALSGGLSDSTVFKQWVPHMIAAEFNGPVRPRPRPLARPHNIASQ